MKKSLIPLQENQGPKVALRALKIPSSPSHVPTSPRKPLTPIQGKLGKITEDEMVGRKAATASGPVDNSGAEAGTKPGPSRINLKKVQSKVISKRKVAEKLDKSIQTDNADLELVTGEEAPLAYWKELAIETRSALQEALKENEQLTAKVEELEKEKQELIELVDDAKALAEMVCVVSNADGADESGIGGEADDTETDTSLNTST